LFDGFSSATAFAIAAISSLLRNAGAITHWRYSSRSLAAALVITMAASFLRWPFFDQLESVIRSLAFLKIQSNG